MMEVNDGQQKIYDYPEYVSPEKDYRRRCLGICGRRSYHGIGSNPDLRRKAKKFMNWIHYCTVLADTLKLMTDLTSELIMKLAMFEETEEYEKRFRELSELIDEEAGEGADA